jgi:putative transposase
VVGEERDVKFSFIADHAARKEFPVTFMCRELGLPRASFYEWENRQESQHDKEDRELTLIIRDRFTALKGNPGVRRIHAELAALGRRISSKRVHRLMRAAGLAGRHPAPSKRRSTPCAAASAPDLIGRNFTAEAKNQRWCGDVTEVKTLKGIVYLAVVMDLYSRRIVGHAFSHHNNTQLTIAALRNAYERRGQPRGVIFHSDRGSNYTSADFVEFCNEKGIIRSLGRTGVCWDNAAAESFFATLKKELVHHVLWTGLTHFQNRVSDWINNYYNTHRRHSTINYLTPLEYELGYKHVNQLAA